MRCILFLLVAIIPFFVPDSLFALQKPSPSPAAGTLDIAQRIKEVPIDDRESFIKWRMAHSKETRSFLEKRWDRFDSARLWKDLTRPDVFKALLLAPRENFCNPEDRERAYNYTVLSLRYGVTISHPHIVAKMTNALDLSPDKNVLEIGTGSGYQAAVLAELTDRVYTIEIIEPLAGETDRLFTKLSADYPEYKNIKRKNADGYFGWEEYAPFDRIIVTCAIDHIPPPLLSQLAFNGIMVIPVGPPTGQTLLKVTKTLNPESKKIEIKREDLYKGGKVLFVPFTREDA
ncbi:MAG: protein-L-isoaspartate O-methyltransferase [Spirochaetales bacterium]|nr:protein-L-isoaspartate O-methyltransferase [Spirochaetales bacterium]